MNTTCLKSLAAVAALLLVVPSMAMADTEYLITFEGNGHGQFVGEVAGTPATFDAAWVTITEGPYANNPSVPTVAFPFLFTYSGVVTFSEPQASVSLFFASAYHVTLAAYDASGAVVDSASGEANFDGGFFQWDLLAVEAPSNVITRVVFAGADRGSTVIDDFRITRLPTDPVELLENLILDVADINLAQGISNSVDAKLDAAFAAITDANANNDVAACNALNALAHFVEVQWDHGRLTDEQAVFLTSAVDQIIALLCPE